MRKNITFANKRPAISFAREVNGGVWRTKKADGSYYYTVELSPSRECIRELADIFNLKKEEK